MPNVTTEHQLVQEIANIAESRFRDKVVASINEYLREVEKTSYPNILHRAIVRDAVREIIRRVKALTKRGGDTT